MRCGIYSRDGFPVALALGQGCRVAGYTPYFRSMSDWTRDCVEPFDLVFIFGLRGKGREILDAYPDAYVVDYGYLRRVMGTDNFETGHWQISKGGLNCLPAGPCPPDRFLRLGIDPKPMKPPARPRILCAQSIGDAAHPFDTAEKLKAWADSIPHDEYRPHPLDVVSSEPLQAMLERAGTVITWNSTVGIDALVAGVPVEAHGPAVYRDTLDRSQLFSRLAYGQWTMNEMASGLPLRFLCNDLSGTSHTR